MCGDLEATSYDYDLPAALVARVPAASRTAARMLHWDADRNVLAAETTVARLPGLLGSGDVLVVNDSRVLPARLRLRRPPGGGRVELLLTDPLADDGWGALAKPARKLNPGDVLDLETADGAMLPGAVVVMTAAVDGRVEVRGVAESLIDLAEAHGSMPLPPYILKARRDDGLEEGLPGDRERYQTVFADETGSVAAPTAGLHLDDELLARLDHAGVTVARTTLHVGIGTFRNPDPDDLRDGRLHAETFHMPAQTYRSVAGARRDGGRIVAVGTTSLRVLETVAALGLDRAGPDLRRWSESESDPRPLFAGEARREGDAWSVSGRTRLFLRPPAVLSAVDGLLTNFHLPGSSLLMLVASALGGEAWRSLYNEAVTRRLHFYSFGDATLILPVKRTSQSQEIT